MGLVSNYRRQRAGKDTQPGIADQVAGAGSSATEWAGEVGRGPLGDALNAARAGWPRTALNVAYVAIALITGTTYLQHTPAGWPVYAAFYLAAAAATAYSTHRTAPYLVRQPTTIPVAATILGSAYNYYVGWLAGAAMALLLWYVLTQVPRLARPWLAYAVLCAATLFGVYAAAAVAVALWLAAKYTPPRPYTLPAGFAQTRPPAIGGSTATQEEGRRRAGAYGELCTAWQLVALPRGGFTIHDTEVPLPGTNANTDHITATRGRVWVLDSKQVNGTVYTNAAGTLCRTYQGKPDGPLTRVLDTTCWEADAVQNATGLTTQVALVVSGGTLKGTTPNTPYLVVEHKGRNVYITTPGAVVETLTTAPTPRTPAAAARLWWARRTLRAAAAGRDPVMNTTWGMG